MKLKLSLALSLVSIVSFATGFVVTLNGKTSFQAGQPILEFNSVNTVVDQPAQSGTLF